MWSRRARKVVTVYTRQGCHLCEQAEAVVRRIARRHDIRLVDIDRDPELTERYTVRVPVITVDDVEIAEFQLEPATLRSALRA